MKRRPVGWLYFSLAVTLLLVACSSTSTLPLTSDSRIISGGVSFGQTFTADNAGLSSVSILLAPTPETNSGSLVFHLRENPQSSNELAQVSLPISEVEHYGYYRFDFSPMGDSQRRDYYLQVDIEGEGQVRVFTNAADSYLDGALYENQVPQDAQLGFRLDYDRLLYLGGIVTLVIKWVGILLVGIFSYILPGWALFSLSWRGWDKLDWGSKLGLSAGLSLAIYPLFILWTNLVGLHLGPIYAWLPPLAGLVTLGWKYRATISQIRPGSGHRFSVPKVFRRILANFTFADTAAVVVIVLLVFTRLWVTRSLDVPLFGDSFQHTMIAQLMIDHGGLFDSWEPYAALSSFTYHFGFHSLAAVFHWISGAASARAVLWTGQLVNILAIVGLYPLAYKLTKNRWAGVIAMLVGGLLTSTPMSYINWGRYTQLAGQVILPAVVWTIWSLFERPISEQQGQNLFRRVTSWHLLTVDFGALAVIWLAFAGLALTHYRILILAILFLPVLVIFSLRRATLIPLIGRTFWIGIGSLILFIPWFIHVYGGTLLAIFSRQITSLPARFASGNEIIYGFKSLQGYLPKTIWVLMILSILLGVYKRKKDLVIFTTWWLVILLAANPQWIGLPGADIITNFAVFIVFYLPAAVMISTLIEWIPSIKAQSLGIGDPANNNNPHPSVVLSSLLLLIICGLGFWGVKDRINDLELSNYALITRPDLRAMAWIQGQTPAEATFLVNSFFAYNDSLVAGSDGGWWIPILAHRKTSLPPLTYGFEQGLGATNVNEINYLNAQVHEKGVTSSDVISMLKERGINYVYIGQRQGRVNYNGPDILDPQVINQDGNFATIYHQDQVWIFEIVP